jgi:transketolase
MDRSAVAGPESPDVSRNDLDDLCIKTLRMLSVDTSSPAKFRNPSTRAVAATMASVLWTRHLRHNPKNPDWPDRDRFVLSAAHPSALLYSLLFVTGYDLSFEDLKHFRHWKSRTANQPEHRCAAGVEVTTGFLGEGFAHAVGFAIAERWLAATFNRARTRS